MVAAVLEGRHNFVVVAVGVEIAGRHGRVEYVLAAVRGIAVRATADRLAVGPVQAAVRGPVHQDQLEVALVVPGDDNHIAHVALVAGAPQQVAGRDVDPLDLVALEAVGVRGPRIEGVAGAVPDVGP